MASQVTFGSTLLSLIFYLCISGSASAELSDSVKVCHRSDPKFNFCIADSIHLFKPHLKTGFPEFEIPVCDPLSLTKLSFKPEDSGITKCDFTDIRVHGLSNFTVKHLDFNLLNDSAKIDVNIPLLKMDSQYAMAGRLLLLPITGSGSFSANYSNIDVSVKIRMEKYTSGIDHKVHLRCKIFHLTIMTKGAEFYLKGLFRGDPNLEQSANRFINTNWELLLNELVPYVEVMLREYFKSYTNSLFNKYPLDTMFPE